MAKTDFDDTSGIATDVMKVGRLLKEAGHSDKSSVNRHIDLHDCYQALRCREKAYERRDQTQDSREKPLGLTPSRPTVDR